MGPYGRFLTLVLSVHVNRSAQDWETQMSVATATVRHTNTATTVKKKDDFNNFPDISDWTDEQFIVTMIKRILEDDELRPNLVWDERLITENRLEIVC
jgi:hypothetical protein